MATRRATDGVIDGNAVLLPLALSFLSRRGQGAQPVVPFAFEGVCDQAVVRIDQHEAPLRQIGLELGAFDGAKAEPIGFLMTRFDLLADLQRQFHRRRRHLGGDQVADCGVDGPACDRLATGFTPGRVRLAADVPCLQPAAPGDIASPEMPAAAPAHRAPLQQRRALPRWRGTRGVEPTTIGLETLQVLLELLPGDVAGMGVGNAGEPVTLFALSLQRLPIGGAPILSPTVDVGACVAGIVQGADRRR